MSLNLASVLEHPARLTPERIAVTYNSQHLTFAEINAAADRVAAGIHALGIRAGDHVALSCPNIPVFPIVYFGILKAGAVVVPLNVLLKAREIAYHLKDSHAKAFFAFEGTAELPIGEMAKAACAEAGCPHLILLPLDETSPATMSGAATLASMMRDGSGFHPPRRDANDTAVVLYTSGTTGHPKGAELTHGNMVGNALTCHHMFRPQFDAGTAQNTTLVTLPLFHSTAQTAQMNAGFCGGFRLVLMPRFEPAAVLDALARERIGLWVGVPTMYWALLQHARANGPVIKAAEALRICVSGGAPMPPAVLEGFEQLFGVRVLEGYGLSETSPVVAFNQLERPSKPGTVGLPVLGVEVRCVDVHDNPVPVGERGEVVVRGPNVMKGYYDRPDATAEAMRGGWFRTGDIGQFDADGYLAIVDRKKDMILRGGFNVYPREIEEVLLEHPAVAQVAVVGVPDERLGEEVKAFVVRRAGATLTADELCAWAREQMAAFKYPRHIEFRDALPMSATGKVLKRELRQLSG